MGLIALYAHSFIYVKQQQLVFSLRLCLISLVSSHDSKDLWVSG